MWAFVLGISSTDAIIIMNYYLYTILTPTPPPHGTDTQEEIKIYPALTGTHQHIIFSTVIRRRQDINNASVEKYSS